jgi:hydroxyethylthiazole kinase-like uncharacterized protein yjeF
MNLTPELIRPLLKPRDKFSHKGNYGHALLIAGSYGKIGAAVLVARACLRSGVGLLTVHLPACGYTIMQTTNPEAMVTTDRNEKIFTTYIDTGKFTTIGIGPGLGTDHLTRKALQHILQSQQQPMVIDADALNILGLHKEMLDDVPQNSILTPHPKEFERIAGITKTGEERLALQIAFSKKYKVFVVLKGANSCISTPDGETYFNTTGNPGMATGGSGDVLTGVITALLAQGYEPLHACMTGVFIHGSAGDLAKEKFGEIGMIAGDICDFLPEAFRFFTLG